VASEVVQSEPRAAQGEGEDEAIKMPLDGHSEEVEGFLGA
jgi:hypothetical protein